MRINGTRSHTKRIKKTDKIVMKTYTTHTLPLLGFILCCFIFYGQRSFSQFVVGDSGNFITVWNSMNSGTITLLGTDAGYNYTLYWEEEGNPDNFDTIFLLVANNYTILGLEPFKDYRIEIAGKFPRLYLNNNAEGHKLKEIRQWGSIAWNSMHAALKGASNIKITAQDTPNLSQVNNMAEMFYGVSNIDGSLANWNWDISSVTTMKSMFEASEFNEDIRTWDVSNVVNMNHTFAHTTHFNQPIGSWDVGKVKDMFETFLFATSFNQDIGSWNVVSVTSMTGMFKYASNFNRNVGGWNLSNVVDLNFMFESSGMDCVNYSKTLMGWASSSTTPSNIWLINLSGRSYSSDAINARNTLINNKGWHFVDDALINDPLPDLGTLSGQDTLCINSTVFFTATQTGGTWNSKNTSIATVNSSGQVFTSSTTGPTSISYTITTTNGCAGELVYDIFVLAPPIAGTIHGIDSLEIHDTVVFTATLPGGTWSVSDSTIASINTTTGEIIGLSTGIVQVSYIRSNQCGTDVSNVILKIFEIPIVPVGIDEINTEMVELSIYPTPTSQNITISYALKQASTKMDITIIDTQGKIIYSENLKNISQGSHTLEVDMSRFLSGHYTVLFSSDNFKAKKNFTKY